MDITITLQQALGRATPSLRSKMLHSVELLQKAEKIARIYDRDDGFYLAFSGGKDSQALLHIAQLAGVQFKAHFSPTSVDPPAVIRFIRHHYPEVSFEPLKESIYTDAIRRGFLPTRRVRFCCADFKENAGAGKVTLIGIRKSESTRRSKRNEVELSNRKFSGTIEGFEEYRTTLTASTPSGSSAFDAEVSPPSKPRQSRQHRPRDHQRLYQWQGFTACVTYHLLEGA